MPPRPLLPKARPASFKIPASTPSSPPTSSSFASKTCRKAPTSATTSSPRTSPPIHRSCLTSSASLSRNTPYFALAEWKPASTPRASPRPPTLAAARSASSSPTSSKTRTSTAPRTATFVLLARVQPPEQPVQIPLRHRGFRAHRKPSQRNCKTNPFSNRNPRKQNRLKRQKRTHEATKSRGAAQR